MSAQDLYNDVRTLIQSKSMDQAIALAKGRGTISINDPGLHLGWADLLEEMGLIDEVIVELNLAIRDDPDNPITYKRLSEVYLDHGNSDRAARCLWTLIKRNPLDASYYRALGQILEEAGEYEKALKVYRVGQDKTGDPSFKTLIRSLDFLGTEEIATQAIQKADQIIPAQHHLVTFTTLFAGREGVYARQWSSPTGETGYTPVHEPFTLKVAENHILGNMTVGVYPVRLDSTVNFIAFDLDMPKFLVNKTITRKSLWEKAMEKVNQAACKLVDLGAAHDIPIHMEDSGFKGRHCWIFLDTPLPAGVAKKFGDMLMSQISGPISDVSIEVFPKQSRVKPGSLGNLIKIPLGYHKKTGKRGLFIKPDGQAYADQMEFLETAAKASRRVVYALIQRLHQKPVPQRPAEETPPWEEDEGKDRRVSLAKVTEEYDLERDPQFQYLILKCPALRSIVEKINRESSITKEETLVLIHTVGHFDHGPEATNHLFQRCMNADPSLFLKSKLRGNPVSCPKIRARIPHITSTVACNCRFDPSINIYPTPLIHVYSMSTEKRVSPLGLTVDSMQFQNMLQEYLKIRKQAREVAVLLGKYEKELEAFFESAGIEMVETPMGTMKITRTPEGGVSFSLEMGSSLEPR